MSDFIRYDLLAQEALRNVVKRVLSDAASFGLPDNGRTHHFYITFLTNHPGVKISSRLKEQYPEEMTIVLQHQFWDLIVSDNHFEVGLSFGAIPERIYIPFEALKAFFDPHVEFGLQFDIIDDDEDFDDEGGEVVAISADIPLEGADAGGGEEKERETAAVLTLDPTAKSKIKATDDKPATADKDKEKTAKADGAGAETGKKPKSASGKAGTKASAKKAKSKEGITQDGSDAAAVESAKEKVTSGGGESAQIVSLDSFRKK